MKNSARYLILSSDTATWKFDQPVLFLGRWCLREHDRNLWENMDALIAVPTGATSNDRYLMLEEARNIESKLFPRFTRILNEFHGLNYDERYWKIVLGHWFRETIDLLINRIQTIEKCFNEFEISGMAIYEFLTPISPGATYSDAVSKTNDDNWNAQVFNKIIELLGIEVIQDKVLKYEIKPISAKSEIALKTDFRKQTKEYIYYFCRRVASKLARESDAVIVNSYLPLEKEFLLNISLGQFPQWRLTPRFEPIREFNVDIRMALGQKLKLSDNTKMEEIVTSLLFDLIPVCYLEGFYELSQVSELADWPRKPRFIFSSNNFVYDEVFKVWTANKVFQGIPYFAGQHGNDYGVNRYLQQTIEEETSDRFLTWGWKRGLEQHTPAFLFKNISNPKRKNKKKPGLILIEGILGFRINVWDQSDQFEKYMREQFRFVLCLESCIRQELTVRLHTAHNQMLGEEDLRWQNFDRTIKVDSGSIPIRDLWQENRIIVHSYDSTGLLETLEANIPTIAFWQNRLDHLVDEAIPYYNLLIGAGIVHLTPESAAIKINEVWDDVEKWWKSSQVQRAREIFCSQYARTSKRPIRDLKKILLESI
jgi:putative transferase (TIGR04331 family)